MTINIQSEYLNDLFTRSTTPHSVNSLVAYVEELLSLGAVVKIMQDDAILSELKSPGQFSVHASKILACFEKPQGAGMSSGTLRV